MSPAIPRTTPSPALCHRLSLSPPQGRGPAAEPAPGEADAGHGEPVVGWQQAPSHLLQPPGSPPRRDAAAVSRSTDPTASLSSGLGRGGTVPTQPRGSPAPVPPAPGPVLHLPACSVRPIHPVPHGPGTSREMGPPQPPRAAPRVREGTGHGLEGTETRQGSRSRGVHRHSTVNRFLSISNKTL